MLTTLGNWTVLNNDVSIHTVYKRHRDLSLYSKDDISSALKFVKNFRTAIDIGAHVGIVSYSLSKEFQEVHSFEINDAVYECLKINRDNLFPSNVTIYNNGIGDKESNVDLNISDKLFSTHVKPNSTGKYKIIPLDQYNFENVDFIKIDAEGFESLIAQGALETIKNNKPVILFERKQHAERYGFSRDSIVEILKPYGYEMLNHKKHGFTFKKSNGILVAR
jgi:FkbM family methyltransferase